MKRPLLWTIIGLTVLTLALGAVALRLVWPLKMSIHGYIALALGCGLTALFAAVLMGLAFYSDRKGFDDLDRE